MIQKINSIYTYVYAVDKCACEMQENKIPVSMLKSTCDKFVVVVIFNIVKNCSSLSKASPRCGNYVHLLIATE